MNGVIEVPTGGDWFEGHFPGRPILPGVAELMLAMNELARNGQSISLRGIVHARLRQLVFPGDRLEVVSRMVEFDRLRMDLTRDGALVANAELLLGPPQPSLQPVPEAPAYSARHGFPPLDQLMPHRAPMRLLVSILQESPQGLHATAMVPGACALASGGSASPLAAVEAAAQAAAAWEALRRWRRGQVAEPRVGYLVALRDMTFFVARVPADREFTVSVELDAAVSPLTHYRIAVLLDGKLVASGTIATFLADKQA